MTNKTLTILGFAVVGILTGLTALWLFGPMFFGPAVYGMGPGMMSGGWMGFGWYGAMLGSIRLAFWLLPIVLIVVLLTWLFQRRASRQDD